MAVIGNRLSSCEQVVRRGALILSGGLPSKLPLRHIRVGENGTGHLEGDLVRAYLSVSIPNIQSVPRSMRLGMHSDAARLEVREIVKSLAPLIAFMVIVTIIVKLFWWILGAVVLTGLFFLARSLIREDRARRAALARRHAEIAARADAQHRWVLQGDDRGVYGDYPIPLIVKQSLPSWAIGRGRGIVRKRVVDA